MSWQVQITLVSLIPLVVSIILHFIFKKSDINYWIKQIIIGLIFGAIAVMGTEFGIPIDGAALNARDAAPLCAGLIFGAPAGVISGLIGGIERWFSVYWGVGSYTRVACTVSTILTGLFGAVLKKKMFDNKIPQWRHALLVGAVAETWHMMMVFITNMSDIKRAFNVVKICAIPMITANALSVTIAVFAINILDKDANFDKHGRITLSQQFLKGMLVVVLLALSSTSLFTFKLQNAISNNDTTELLQININDIKEDVDSRSNKYLLNICYKVKKELDEDITNDELIKLLDLYDVAEINVVNYGGIITKSTNFDFINFNMRSGEQANEFMCLTKDEKEYVQSYQATSSNPNIYRKYAGISLDGGGFLQVGLNAQQFQNELANEVNSIANHKHIGEKGGVVIFDSNKTVVSDSLGYTGEAYQQVLPNFDINSYEELTLNKTLIADNEYYFMYTIAEGYTIISYIPAEEADFSKNIAVYLNIFLQVITFAAIFVLTFFMTKRLVVDNVRSVDKSLQKITDGDLDTRVNIRINEEFDSLSTEINETVDAMKGLIADANKRIDDELQYAKEIQASSLPSVFPPFPDRSEFDIYATMDPAKEVGGDFYDFYMINKHTIAFLIADVAGKGIPAALFMMRAKTILKTYALGGIEVNDIFTNANYNLCEGNDAGMFVTAWMGILDTKTGELRYANAGHNRPLLRRKDGTYEYLKGPAGFVLAGMEGIVYKQQSTTLEVGDEIFLYTDGVVEATDKDKKLYGDDRLHACINIYRDEDSEHLIKKIKEDVDKFYEGAPQFDDITMLSLKYVKQYVHVDKTQEIK